MTILVITVDGLGNGIMATPLVQVLHEHGHSVDVLCDWRRGQDIAFKDWACVGKLWNMEDIPKQFCSYDAALWCHPFSGQILEKVESTLHHVVEPAHGTGPWIERYKKHEVLYNVELAAKVGCKIDNVPGLRVFHQPVETDPKKVAIGIGYLKANARWKARWKCKYWGTENYRALCKKLVEAGLHPVLVGDALDYAEDGKHIMQPGVSTVCGQSLEAVVDEIGRCRTYCGGDTGLCHSAAACRKPCVIMFNKQGSSMVKNHPWGVPWVALENPSVSLMFNSLLEL